MINGKLNRDRAAEAVRRSSHEMKDRLNAFGVMLREQDLQESYGAWLLPAELRASEAVRKSYELHLLLEEVENKLKDATAETFTIDLLTQARK